jgi:protein phosphatase
MIQIRVGSQSVVGNYRENNEDNLHIDQKGRFYIVCDGMGGQSAGEKASELAVDLVPKKLLELLNFRSDPTDKVLQCMNDAVKYANAEIMALGEIETKFRNMGTTIALVVVSGEKLYVGNVGDSRVYLLRGNELSRQTIDHSLTEALVQAGTITREDASSHRYKNVLYRYLGAKEGAQGTDPKELQVLSGDRLMICSDGVNDGLSDEQIQTTLLEETEPQAAAEKIVQRALDEGSRDNVTSVVLFVD